MTLKSHGPIHKFEGGPRGPWNLMDLYINLKEVPGDPEISCGPAHEFESGSRRPRKLTGLTINVKEVPRAPDISWACKQI